MQSLVEQKLPLVDRALNRFRRQNPGFTASRSHYLLDDLRSAGRVELVEAIAKGVHDDAHLMRRIRFAMSRELDAQLNFIRIPQRTRRHAAQNGKEPPGVKCVFPEHFDPIDSKGNVDQLFIEILDCCRDEIEEIIVRLAADGLSRKEIAKQRGLTPRRVTQILKAVERRFDGDGDKDVESPVRCRCGGRREARFTNDQRCEDCYAADQQKYHGRSQRARIVA